MLAHRNGVKVGLDDWMRRAVSGRSRVSGLESRVTLLHHVEDDLEVIATQRF